MSHDNTIVETAKMATCTVLKTGMHTHIKGLSQHKRTAIGLWPKQVDLEVYQISDMCLMDFCDYPPCLVGHQGHGQRTSLVLYSRGLQVLDQVEEVLTRHSASPACHGVR